MQTEEIITEFLTDLDLDAQEIKIYKIILEYGSQTVLQTSKISALPRTSVYRTIQNLTKKGLVEQQIVEKQIKNRVVDPEKLSRLISAKQQNIKRLESNLSEIKNIIIDKSNKLPNSTKILHYVGKEGAKQMLWNLLRTKDEFRGYSYCTPMETVEAKYAIEWAIEFNLRKIKARDLYSDNYKISAKNHPYPKHISWPTWESKYISKDKLNIDHQVDIYNDVVAYYDWHGGEIFGVEIYYPKIANLQKQVFDLIWKD